MSRRRPTLRELLAQDRVDEALALVEAALEDQPTDPALLRHRAEILARLGRAGEACETLIVLADLMAGRGFGGFAAEALELADQIDPRAPGVAERLGTVAALKHLDDVSTSAMFEMFSRDELIAVVRELRHRSFEPGEIVLVQGKPGHSLFVIASGEVRIYQAGDEGWPVQINHLHAPQFFGEIALLDGGIRTATVIAASPVQALVLTAEGLANVDRSEPRVREVLRTFADERLARTAGPPPP